MKLFEMLAINESISGQLSKVENEITDRFAALQKSIDDLTAQLASAELTPEQAASVLAVQAEAQKLDDLTPDIVKPPIGDTTKPTAPTNVVATVVSGAQVDLAWTASTDDVGVTGYNIFRDGFQVGTPAINAFSDLGLTGGTAYSYTISAFDAAANVSDLSAPVLVTTTL